MLSYSSPEKRLLTQPGTGRYSLSLSAPFFYKRACTRTRAHTHPHTHTQHRHPQLSVAKGILKTSVGKIPAEFKNYCLEHWFRRRLWVWSLTDFRGPLLSASGRILLWTFGLPWPHLHFWPAPALSCRVRQLLTGFPGFWDQWGPSPGRREKPASLSLSLSFLLCFHLSCPGCLSG